MRLLQPKSVYDSFDELRLYNRFLKKDKPISELPPTSHSILLRCFYVVNLCVNLLKPDIISLDPLKFGWMIKETDMLPEKMLLPMPHELIDVCGCAIKCTNRCKCFRNQVPCTEYCKCGDRKCENVD